MNIDHHEAARRLISLELWSARFQPQPHIKTVRRWAREAKIVPAPKKVGRSYYVEEDAQYVDWSELSGAARAKSA